MLYEAGQSTLTVGQRFGVSPATMARELKRAGLVLRPRPGWHV